MPLAGEERPVLAYLSTSDYVQHKHCPGDAGALAFYSAVDKVLGHLDDMGVTLGVTADHGMNDKVRSPASVCVC